MRRHHIHYKARVYMTSVRVLSASLVRTQEILVEWWRIRQMQEIILNQAKQALAEADIPSKIIKPARHCTVKN